MAVQRFDELFPVHRRIRKSSVLFYRYLSDSRNGLLVVFCQVRAEKRRCGKKLGPRIRK